MRVLLQRVDQASCYVDDQLINEIKQGLMLLVGFGNNDSLDNLQKMAKKIANLRIFNDENGKMNLSIKDIKGEILSISQFTLYADTKSGNRPSFIDSLNPTEAKILYEKFNDILNIEYQIIAKPGIFGADMKLYPHCEGPVTIILEF